MKNSKNEPSIPMVFSGDNLSHVWARVVCHAAASAGGEIKPLVASLYGFDKDGMPQEDQEIRSTLDGFLKGHDKWSVEIVGFTIFPQRYLQVTDGDRYAFYEMCFDALPHIKAKNPQLNARGLYFERLMQFGRGKENDNQLDFIITEYLDGRHRRSALQASIYDPARDQSKQPYQTFPCLQTVSFVPTAQGLVVNGFYAMQYLIQRAYGNFLGLSHLGAFMAREMKLPLAQVNMIAGVEKLDFSKIELTKMLKVIKEKLPNLDGA